MTQHYVTDSSVGYFSFTELNTEIFLNLVALTYFTMLMWERDGGSLWIAAWPEAVDVCIILIVMSWASSFQM